MCFLRVPAPWFWRTAGLARLRELVDPFSLGEVPERMWLRWARLRYRQPMFTTPCFFELHNSASAPPRRVQLGVQERGPGPWARRLQARSGCRGASWRSPHRRFAFSCPRSGTSWAPRQACPPHLRRLGVFRELLSGAAGNSLGKPAPPRGTRRHIFQPRGFFVFLPTEVSGFRDCCIYSPSSFALF